jgi:hypothetical protein
LFIGICVLFIEANPQKDNGLSIVGGLYTMKTKRSSELKVSDVSIGDLVLVREDSRNFPKPVYNEYMNGSVFRWCDMGKDECRNFALLYIGKQRHGQFSFHKFLHGDETYFIRGHHFRYLRKV